jgi:hypothetical protein
MKLYWLPAMQVMYKIVLVFLIFNQFFSHSNLRCPLLQGVTKNYKNPVAYWEHGIWRFSKKN